VANQKATIALWSELLETFASTLKQLTMDGNPEKTTATRYGSYFCFAILQKCWLFFCLDCLSQTSRNV